MYDSRYWWVYLSVICPVRNNVVLFKVYCVNF